MWLHAAVLWRCVRRLPSVHAGPKYRTASMHTFMVLSIARPRLPTRKIDIVQSWFESISFYHTFRKTGDLDYEAPILFATVS